MASDQRGRPNIPRGTPLAPGAVDTSSGIRHPSPSLDPIVIKSLDGYEGNEGYVEAAVSALTTVQKAIADVINARDRLRATPTLTDDARVMKLADYAFQRQEAGTQALDGAMARLNAAIKSISDSLDAPLRASADTTV